MNDGSPVLRESAARSVLEVPSPELPRPGKYRPAYRYHELLKESHDFRVKAMLMPRSNLRYSSVNLLARDRMQSRLKDLGEKNSNFDRSLSPS